jgi:hypothetical protein
MMDPNNDKDREEMARLHNDPPEVPRDRMWERIDAARTARRGVVAPDFTPRRGPTFRVLRMTAAVAAVLLVGFFIGRLTENPDRAPLPGTGQMAVNQSDTNAVTTAPRIQDDVYAMAARDLFGRADFLLTDFKVRSCGTDDLSKVPDWAGGMLVQTRLLMGTSAADDLEMKILLEELELVLAQIVGLSRDNCARDMAWIRDGLRDRATIDRLRTVSAGRPL